MECTISEMAKMLDISPSTLRYYDSEGLLPFIERTKGGIRIFNNSDFEFLQIIKCLKSTGLQIKDIKKFINMLSKGEDSIDERLELFTKQKNEVEKQILKLQETLDIIDYKCWYYQTAKKSGSTTVPDNTSDNEVPKKFHFIRNKLKNK